MQNSLFPDKNTISARALLLGEHIELRALATTDRLALLPLTVNAGEQGCAVLFRYGAVVLFNLSPVEEVSFLTYLQPLVREPFAEPETEKLELQLDSMSIERVKNLESVEMEGIKNGIVLIHDFTLERVQILADILAKSVILAHYEASIEDVFDRIEPLAVGLQTEGRVNSQGRELLSHIGGTFLVQHKMVGLVAVEDKPETLWEHPELERLYVHLEKEYEIRERHRALERKLVLISRTVEAVLELLQHNSSLRVEWYIVALIVMEILLTLYELFVA